MQRLLQLAVALTLGALVWFPSASMGADLDEPQIRAQNDQQGALQHDDDAGAPRAEGASITASSRWALALLLAYCALVIPASLVGGWLPFVIELTHTRIQLMISLVGGLMLGIGLFHLLPHSVAHLGSGSLDLAIGWMMVGLLSMFFLIRLFHFHQHGPTERFDGPLSELAGGLELAAIDHAAHEHSGGPHREHAHAGPLTLSWAGVAFGLSLHTLIDGMAVAASVKADAAHAAPWSLLGVGTFLAVLLHKPLDAVSITSLMTAEGWTARQRHFVNAAFALVCPLGALLFYFGLEQFTTHHDAIVGGALAFAAGVFVCISLSDLLPELELHSHDRLKFSLALLVGIGLAYSIGYLEPEHVHSHGAEQGRPADDDDHLHHEHAE